MSSLSARLFITSRDLTGYLDGDKKEPEVGSPEHVVWCKENATVMSWLLASMTPRVPRTVHHFPTTVKIWEKVSKTYGQKKNNARIYRLNQDIAALRQGDMSVATYFAILEGLWEELDHHLILDWENARDKERHDKQIEESKAFKFLDGLDPVYEGIRSQILGRDELPELHHVYYLVRNEEVRRREM
ncbi:PREDICTED: uncharacterized protein LOC104591183 [Nelumbo nucifera]|uniref:Uncharacterized protein LOC104591183 n=1 Tax=Nelumbo nucifera TaxID=4432 RepID=A0A1U7Z795_NELNU|nr:PREDICTED: uncharacterized protein LOC104591183 [Nelumbo nucifera]